MVLNIVKSSTCMANIVLQMTQLLNNIKIGGGLDMDYVTPILKKCVSCHSQPTGYNFPSFSCKSTAATPNPDATVLRTNGFIRSGSFSTGSCSRYSLRSEYTRSCASFHCTCSDFPFLRRSDSGAEISAKAGMWSL